MPFQKSNRHHAFNGIFFICLFVLSSYYLASLHWVAEKGFSPIVIAIVLGMTYGSTLRHHLPHEWTPGIQFIAKRILRLAVILYGFRLTFQQIAAVGFDGFILDLLIVSSTLIIGTWAGIKLFKLDGLGLRNSRPDAKLAGHHTGKSPITSLYLSCALAKLSLE